MNDRPSTIHARTNRGAVIVAGLLGTTLSFTAIAADVPYLAPDKRAVTAAGWDTGGVDRNFDRNYDTRGFDRRFDRNFDRNFNAGFDRQFDRSYSRRNLDTKGWDSAPNSIRSAPP